MDKIPYIVPQKKFGNFQTQEIGNKALGLAKLVDAKIPLPKAFVVPSLTLKAVLDHNQLLPKLLHTLAQIEDQDEYSLKSGSQLIRKLIANQTIPEDICLVIIKAYHTLIGAQKFVAARVSSPDIDQLSTHNATLNIKGETNLLESILELWSEEYLPEKLATILKSKHPQHFAPPSILIQEMIDAQSAGLAFSQDPRTDNKKQILIQSVWGIADHIQENPATDQFLVDIRTDNLVIKNIAHKKTLHTRQIDGTKTDPVPKKKQDQASLPDEVIIALAQMVKRLKRQHLEHIKIEWALNQNQLYLLGISQLTDDDQQLIQASPWSSPKTSLSTPQAINNLTQVLPHLTTEYQLDTNNQNQANFYFAPTNLLQFEHLKTIKPNSSHATWTIRLIDQNKGCSHLLTDHKLLKNQLAILTKILHQHRTIKLNLVIPLIRAPHELSLMKHLLTQEKILPQPHVSLYMEISTPENIHRLHQYLSQKVDSFLINTQNLETFLLGKEPHSAPTNSFDTHLVKDYLEKLTQYLPERSAHFHAKIIMTLPEPNLELVKLGVANQWDLVVKPSQVNLTQRAVQNLENQIFSYAHY